MRRPKAGSTSIRQEYSKVWRGTGTKSARPELHWSSRERCKSTAPAVACNLPSILMSRTANFPDRCFRSPMGLTMQPSLANQGAQFIDDPTVSRETVHKPGAHESGASLRSMKSDAAKAITDAVANWAGRRDDIRAMALAGSWARGEPRDTSDLDLLLLSDQASLYRETAEWLASIDFAGTGHRPR